MLSASGCCYTVIMFMINNSPLDVRRRKAVLAAINRVLGKAQRATVRELVSAEMGAKRATPLQILSWMRVNMPAAADRVDDVLHPIPFAL